MFDAIAGPDGNDGAAITDQCERVLPSLSCEEGAANSLQGLVIGIPDEYRVDELSGNIISNDLSLCNNCIYCSRAGAIILYR